MTTSRRYHVTALACLLVSMALCLASWKWADAVFRGGEAKRAYVIGAVGSAIPAVVLGACLLWLRAEEDTTATAGVRKWLVPVLMLAATLMGFMILFPLM